MTFGRRAAQTKRKVRVLLTRLLNQLVPRGLRA